LRLVPLFAALSLVAASVPVGAASPRFGLEYRVERRDAGVLSLPTCLATARRASAEIGYAPAAVNMFPGQLAVFASGPARGGGSMTVYCIAVDRKTAFVVQVLDYNRAQSPAAKRAADHVHRALLAAR
jgi:hypothetical protein